MAIRQEPARQVLFIRAPGPLTLSFWSDNPIFAVKSSVEKSKFNMISTIEQLQATIEQNYIRLQLVPESSWSDKQHPTRWSKKEILGHLVDSAHNNLRRLIVTQYHQGQKIVYDQDFWVACQDYHHMPSNNLIELWKLMNLQLIRTSQLIPSDKYHFTTDVGQKEMENITIEELFDMYIDHMKHHLRQIFGE